MINSSRQNNQVILLQPYAYPVVRFASHIKEPFPIKNVSDLLIFMEVLVEKHFHFVVIDITHFVGRDYNLISILVAALFGNCVDIVYGRAAVVDHTEIAQIVTIQRFPRIVILALVTLN
jgi:hypothetical protein